MVLRRIRDRMSLEEENRELSRVHRREIYDQIREANQSALVKPDVLASVAERLKNAR